MERKVITGRILFNLSDEEWEKLRKGKVTQCQLAAMLNKGSDRMLPVVGTLEATTLAEADHRSDIETLSLRVTALRYDIMGLSRILEGEILRRRRPWWRRIFQRDQERDRT